MNNLLEICIDFDGTCVTHDFPRVGQDVGAVPVLKKLAEQGHKLILFTMRSDIKKTPQVEGQHIMPAPAGNYLTAAVNWFKENNIPLYGIQENPTQKNWTESPKAYGQLYIDDAALGCPLVIGEHGRPFVDWVKVEAMLIEQQILAA